MPRSSQSRGVIGPHIVIAPKSTISNWYREVQRWCPSLRAFRFHGDKSTRAQLKEQYLDSGTGFDVCITTYEVVISEKAALSKLTWRYLIIDEGHVIKNSESLISQSVRRVHFAHALLLTGTPLQNNLHELWSLLKYVPPPAPPWAHRATSHPPWPPT